MYFFLMVMELVIVDLEIFYFLFWILGILYEIRIYISDKFGVDISVDVYV